MIFTFPLVLLLATLCSTAPTGNSTHISTTINLSKRQTLQFNKCPMNHRNMRLPQKIQCVWEGFMTRERCWERTLAAHDVDQIGRRSAAKPPIIHPSMSERIIDPCPPHLICVQNLDDTGTPKNRHCMSRNWLDWDPVLVPNLGWNKHFWEILYETLSLPPKMNFKSHYTHPDNSAIKDITYNLTATVAQGQ